MANDCDVSQIVYVTGILLGKSKLAGCPEQNCDSDVSKPQHIGYVNYHSTEVGCLNMHEPVT